MTDHADTIRRFANDTDPTGEVVAALDELLAELQQAQQERDDWEGLYKKAIRNEGAAVQREQQAIDERDGALSKLAEASDALRHLANLPKQVGPYAGVQEFARAALESLGESVQGHRVESMREET